MRLMGASAPNQGTYMKMTLLSADAFGRPSVNPPAVITQDNLTMYGFTLNTDSIYVKYQMPTDYASGSLMIYVMWTNDGGVDDNGLAVKWQIDYQISDTGEIVSGSHANSPRDVEDTYDSATGWLLYHTAAIMIPSTDFTDVDHMLFMKLSAVTPGGAALTCEPNLIGLHVMYRAFWGRIRDCTTM